MGQHNYYLVMDGREISVKAGWDGPLRQIFLVVESTPIKPELTGALPLDEADAIWDEWSDGYKSLYCNLLEPIRDVAALQQTLEGLDLPIPTGFLDGVQRDQDNPAGDVVVEYGVAADAS